MMIGYADEHDGDCYRMWEPIDYYIYLTRDVIWLKRMYYANQSMPNTDYVIEVPTEGLEAGENGVQNQTSNASNAPPTPNNTNIPTLRVTVGGQTIDPNEVENEDETNEQEEQDFEPVKLSRTGRKIYPRKFYQEEY